jgi:hypothetical protein
MPKAKGGGDQRSTSQPLPLLRFPDTTPAAGAVFAGPAARAGQNGGKDDLEGSAELEILGQREDAHFRR